MPRAGVGLGFLRLPSMKKKHAVELEHIAPLLASVGLEPPNRPTLTVLAVHRTVRKKIGGCMKNSFYGASVTAE